MEENKISKELKETIFMLINRPDLKDKQKIALIKYYVECAEEVK